jgi:Type II secretion system (T2SS), protein K
MIRLQTHRPARRRRRRGMVLVLVLVAIALLSLAGFTFAELMFAEREGAWVQGRRMQSRALANSGVELAKTYAALDDVSLAELGGVYDNPDRFRGVLVCDDATARDRGRFAILALAVHDGIAGGVRYGLEDESNRLNLNVLAELEKQQAGAGQKLLMALPGMTEETADAILDWLDDDDEQRQLGAEADYYSGLSPAYAPRNGPLTSVEELLLVRDVTPALLFGGDVNRNGMLDANESAGAAIEGVDNADGSMDLGWSAYLTVYSAETNLAADGSQKIDLNAEDLQQLHADLTEALSNSEWATYICAYRQYGPTTINPTQAATATAVGGRELDLTKAGSTQFKSVLDLIGNGVQATFRGTTEPVLVASPFSDKPQDMSGYLSKLMEAVTVGTAQAVPGRININQAPKALLMGIPGMREDLVQQIVAERDAEPSDAQPDRRYPTWLLSEGLVTLDEMKQLWPMINTGGRVFRAQIVGYFEESGPATRLEVVIDATAAPARVLLWRDMSHLGPGYSAETLGISAAP